MTWSIKKGRCDFLCFFLSYLYCFTIISLSCISISRKISLKISRNSNMTIRLMVFYPVCACVCVCWCIDSESESNLIRFFFLDCHSLEFCVCLFAVEIWDFSSHTYTNFVYIFCWFRNFFQTIFFTRFNDSKFHLFFSFHQFIWIKFFFVVVLTLPSSSSSSFRLTDYNLQPP